MLHCMLTNPAYDINSYIVVDEATRQAALIDPSGDAARLCARLAAMRAEPTCILLTHGHYDHISALDGLKARGVQAPVCIHARDAGMLTDAGLNLSPWLCGQAHTYPAAERLLQDGDTIRLGEGALTVLHTPGHTPGGVCYYDAAGNALFSGDTLFDGAVGRSDFPGGDHGALITSIARKLLALPDDTALLPGHGGDSSLGVQRRVNPFLQGV
nr:MBL fold metallo-hydrolase [Maliibacterium massiliense]